MGRRRFIELYPKWSLKKYFGSIPKWLRARGHRKLRRVKAMDPSEWQGHRKRLRGWAENRWF